MSAEVVMEFFNNLTNDWRVAILSTLLFVIYIAFLISRIINIKHHYTAEFMEFAEDILYKIERGSMKAFTPLWFEYTDTEGCKQCIHPSGSFYGSLHSSLFTGTLQRIKTARHRNGFHSKNEDELRIYAEKLGARLRNQSQSDMVSHSKGLGKLIEDSNDSRYSENDGVEALMKILCEAIRLKKLETKDILITIFWWKGH